MIRAWYRFKQWWRELSRPPVVVIEVFGEKTKRPQVVVSMSGVRGWQTVYAYDADSVGHAKATLHGQGLAHISQCCLIDQRKRIGAVDE